MAKDASGGLVKSKAKGTVNFPPFENLDDASMREINRYQIFPFGNIEEYCRHIPYNSGKKDFYEKTGRESFEVFQYIFKVPGDDNEYTVMWDYNVGLVRMTPFFKCCRYSKTQPAKMLNMNPGLRDITHSITGGSIMAQGYWMPFSCAKAVCATFCGSIAGALIPIFGPDFPSKCTSPDAPDHGRMAINPTIVAESAREAEMFRRMYANANSVAANSHLPSQQQQQQQQQLLHQPPQMHLGNGGPHYSLGGPPLPSPTSIPSPRLARRVLKMQQRYGSPRDFERERLGFDGRMRFKRGPDSPYGTDSEPESHTDPEKLSLHLQLNHSSMPYSPLSPPRSSGSGAKWTVLNHPHPHPHPQNHPHSQSHRPAPHTIAQHSHSVSAPTSTYRESEFAYPTGIPGGPGPNPLLSAVPRFGHNNQRLKPHQPPPHPLHSQRLPPIPLLIPNATTWHTTNNTPPVLSNISIPQSHHNINSKRRAADVLEETADAPYDEYDSDKSSPTTTVTTNTSLSRASACREDEDPEMMMRTGPSSTTTGGDKYAATLLMNLSVRDHKDSRGGGAGVRDQENHQQYPAQDSASRVPRGCGPESMSMSPVSGTADGHRSKRRRATSM